MIWYIIFATVFSFQNGYVICTENVPSMEYGDPNDPRFNSVLVAINRYNRPSNTYTFLCVGALLTQEYVVTVASCLNGLNDDTEMVVYSGDILEGSALITAVFGLTFHPQTRGLNKNIALLWINFPQTTIGRLRFLSRPKSALNISTPTRIYILRFTFHQTENGNFTNGTERIWLDFRYGDKVQYPYSFAAFNTHGSQIPLQMADLGCPAFHDNHFIGLLSWINILPDGLAYFTDVFIVNRFITLNMM